MTGARISGPAPVVPSTGGAVATLKLCDVVDVSLPVPVTVIRDPTDVLLLASEICKTAFCVSVMMLAESIVIGELAMLMPPEEVVGVFRISL